MEYVTQPINISNKTKLTIEKVFKDKPDGHCLFISEGCANLVNSVTGFIQLNDLGNKIPYLYGFYDRGNERILVVVEENSCLEQAMFLSKEQLMEIME